MNQTILERIQTYRKIYRRRAARLLTIGVFGLAMSPRPAQTAEPTKPLAKEVITPEKNGAENFSDAALRATAEKMEQNGRFFVNKNTHEVIYKTNAEISKLNIGPVADVGDISRARETGTPHTAGAQAKVAAYGNAQNAYLGAYQMSLVHFQNMLLFGLSQTESTDIRALCRAALKSNVSETTPALLSFAKSYKKSLSDMTNGISSRVALNNTFGFQTSTRRQAVALLSANTLANAKPLLARLNRQNPQAMQELQDRFMAEVYIPLSASQQQRAQIPLESYGALFASLIHGVNAENFRLAKNGQAKQLVEIEGRRNANLPLMRTAHNNIGKLFDNQVYLDWAYVKQCGKLGADIEKIRENRQACVRQYHANLGRTALIIHNQNNR